MDDSWRGGGGVNTFTIHGFLELTKVVGSGGFGVVVSSNHALEKKKYAIKMVPMHNEATKDKLFHEVRKISGIPKHDNVVSYVTSWENTLSKSELDKMLSTIGANRDAKDILCVPPMSSHINLICIQMELCDQNLKTWLKKRTEHSFNMDTNESIFLQIVSGLKHIHENGIIHRDVKPDNILLCLSQDSSITAKIGDFGYSVVHTPGDYSHTADAGAFLFRAPEQAHSRHYGPAVDVYAVGLIAYLLSDLSTNDNFGKAIQDFRYGRDANAKLSKINERMRSVVAALTEYEPDKRPSCEEILKMFKKVDLVQQTTQSMDQISIKQSGCKHYDRNCQIQCPKKDCARWFWCRLCHDEEVKGHVLNRFGVNKVKCIKCKTVQNPSNECLICKTKFGKYYCKICIFFDDGKDADLVFHCSDCGICRRREAADVEYSHCHNCNMCVRTGTVHTCSGPATALDCGYCKKGIFNSTEFTRCLNACGHFVHKGCYEKFPTGQKKCPPCGNW